MISWREKAAAPGCRAGGLHGYCLCYLLALSFSGSVVDEPAPAAPPVEPEPDIDPEPEPDVEPPLAGGCFSALEDEDEAAPEGELGELGVVVPEDEDDAPDGEVVLPCEAVPPFSPHALSMLTPNAKETASANFESLIISPPWLG